MSAITRLWSGQPSRAACSTTHTAGCAVCLIPFLFACAGDSTAFAADVPEVVSDSIRVEMWIVNVRHDCDPAVDNPGDFQTWHEIWQDADPGPSSDSRRLAATPKSVTTIHSGETSRNVVRVDALVARVPGRDVSVHASVRELDNGVPDANSDQVTKLSWSIELECWTSERPLNGASGPGGSCLRLSANGDSYLGFWTNEVRKREDIFNLFNPDDEGCSFDVGYRAYINRDRDS